jgi:hypothetical protein
MAYKRSSMIEGRRLVSIRYEESWSDLNDWGRFCDCSDCEGPRRFLHSATLDTKLQIYRRKFKWLSKRHPKLIELIGEQDADRYERTGQYNENWRQDIVN